MNEHLLIQWCLGDGRYVRIVFDRRVTEEEFSELTDVFRLAKRGLVIQETVAAECRDIQDALELEAK